MVESTMPGEVSDQVAAFVRHWQSLRVGDALPTSQDFLDKADPGFQPFLNFNDIDESGANRVSLFGTGLVDLWKVDLTGKEVHEFLSDEQAHRLNTDLLRCANMPCGIWEVSSFRTTSGRIVLWEMVSVPLGLGDPDRKRIVRYCSTLEPTEHGELIQDILYFQKKEWIDIGSGIPAQEPLLKAS